MSPPGLVSVGVFNYLGLDPHAQNLPNIVEMRKLFRSLQLLLHPDKARTSGDAACAQRMGFNFMMLHEIEEWLDLQGDDEQFAKRLRGRAHQERDRWVSTWNPHGIESGAFSRPLPSWVRWSKQKASSPGNTTHAAGWSSSSTQGGSQGTTRPAYSKRVSTTPQSLRRGTYAPANISAFPPSGIPYAPRFDDPTVMSTEELVRMGCLHSSGRRPCVAIARVIFSQQSQAFAIAELDETEPSGIIIRIQGNPYSTICYRDVLQSAVEGSILAEKGVESLRVHFMGIFELSVRKGESDRYIKRFLTELEKAQNEHGY